MAAGRRRFAPIANASVGSEYQQWNLESGKPISAKAEIADDIWTAAAVEPRGRAWPSLRPRESGLNPAFWVAV